MLDEVKPQSFSRSRPQLTLARLLKRHPFERSCLCLLNQLIFSPHKAQADYGGTYYDLGNKLHTNLGRLRRRLSSGNYQFSPYIHKTITTGGRKREIYLATWPDKVVEKWLSGALNHALNDWFCPHSYAYRPGIFGLDLCQSRVARANRLHIAIIRRDISNYFYSIPHNQLLDKLAGLVDPNDPLYALLQQRVRFEHTDGCAQVGIPFGSSIACVLANIYLTDLDKQISAYPVRYFRYADDFLIISDKTTAAEVSDTLDQGIQQLGLELKPSHKQNLSFDTDLEGFNHVNRFRFLGVVFTDQKLVRLGVEKQRKIINLFRKELLLTKSKLRKLDRQGRIELAINAANDVLLNRIRSAAIVDYYLKHVNDEDQLRQMDMLIARHVISAILGKPFRYRDFTTISYAQLRTAGLPSLVHRYRLHKQGHLHVNFLNMHNLLTVKRHREMLDKRQQRINHATLARKLKKQALKNVPSPTP